MRRQIWRSVVIDRYPPSHPGHWVLTAIGTPEPWVIGHAYGERDLQEFEAKSTQCLNIGADMDSSMNALAPGMDRNAKL